MLEVVEIDESRRVVQSKALGELRRIRMNMRPLGIISLLLEVDHESKIIVYGIIES